VAREPAQPAHGTGEHRLERAAALLAAQPERGLDRVCRDGDGGDPERRRKVRIRQIASAAPELLEDVPRALALADEILDLRRDRTVGEADEDETGGPAGEDAALQPPGEPERIEQAPARPGRPRS